MTSANAVPVIEYATGAVAFPRRFGRVALAASLPSIIVPFVPFVWDVSPWEASQYLLNREDFFDTLAVALLGIGFFAAIAAFAWRALLVCGCRVGRLTRATFLASAAFAWAATIWLNILWSRAVIEQIKDGTGPLEALWDAMPYILGVPLAALGLTIAWRLHRKGDRDRAVSMLLTIPFLTTATSCLLGFRGDDWQLGYYLSMYVVLIWSAEIAVDGFKLVRERWQGRRRRKELGY